MSIILTGFLTFTTQMLNQLIKSTPRSRALLQTLIVTQKNKKHPTIYGTSLMQTIHMNPNFNFNLNSVTTFTHFHDEPEAKQVTKAP
jgi:hypothetical protein